MIKEIVVIILLLFGANSYSQESKFEIPNHEMWSKNFKFQPKHFTGTSPDTINPHNCYVAKRIKTYLPKVTLEELHFYIITYFNGDSSWLKGSWENKFQDYAIVIFDITEIAARKIRRDFSGYLSKDTDYKLTIAYLNQLFEKYVYEAETALEMFDLESNYGESNKVIRKWKKNTLVELKKLRPYSNPLIVVRRDFPKEYIDK
jgi:hypothetical protein